MFVLSKAIYIYIYIYNYFGELSHPRRMFKNFSFCKIEKICAMINLKRWDHCPYQ